jgi:ADP-ribosylglycohydrolase
MTKEEILKLEQQTRLDRIRGCMVGGAVGDALGYPVEFLNISAIRTRYGQAGITRYEMNDRGVAEISDDTQMTLFTANGLLYSDTKAFMQNLGGTPEYHIDLAYDEWYQTQTGQKSKSNKYCWIRDIPELNDRRAPGTTCMSALQCLHGHTEVRNNSKGCGGIMRVAPIALYPLGRIGIYKYAYIQDGCGSAENAWRIAAMGAYAAKITHKHPLGIYPATMLVHLIYRIVYNPPDSIALEDIVDEALDMHGQKDYPEETTYMKNLVRKAVQLSTNAVDDVDAIGSLGEGWTGDEAYAIAIYCVLRYRHDFEKAVITAVNHSGDSDSTGAITGNIMGALLGRKAIPAYYTEKLELLPVIEELAHDLFTGCIIREYDPIDITPEKLRWYKKYCLAEYIPE